MSPHSLPMARCWFLLWPFPVQLCQPGWGTPSPSTIQTHLIKSYSSSFFFFFLMFASTNARVKQQSYDTFPKLPVQSRKQQKDFYSLVGLNCCHKDPRLLLKTEERSLPWLCWFFLTFACSTAVSRSDTRKF